ncbi:MAG: hypothetical protein H0W82_00010 [Actinobacteria bacterium]|nr:hypothetical protein [Actinomycetota bacterium]
MPIYQPGDTVRLSTKFLVGTTPTDPTTVVLEVMGPFATTPSLYTYALAEITRDSTGVYHKDILVPSDVPSWGIWTWRWIGTGTAAGVDEGTFNVELSLASTALLCSVDDVRAFLDKPVGDVAQDDTIQGFIARASDVIRTWTGREFVAAGINPATRLFDVGGYNGSREVPIGDLASTPTAVGVVDADGVSVSTVAVATNVVALPLARGPGDPITSLRLRSAVALSGSYLLSVTGTWGFPLIPGDVRQACITTVGIWMRRDIQAFTQTFNVSEDRLERPEALPSAARAMLNHYLRIGAA